MSRDNGNGVSGTAYPLLGVVGPTATGKSELALALARGLDGEIINCDAMQVYRGLDIGTAKVTPSARAGIPHHLIDVVDVDEFFSAGRFQQLARVKLAEIKGRGKIPILVGGTGFYLRTLLRGIFAGPGRDENLRGRFQRINTRRGPAPLHRILARHDPEAAGRIGPRDHQRVARALEVLILTGRPLSRHFQTDEQELRGFAPRIYCLNLPRPLLYERINQRVKNMMAAGWVEEVRGLLAAGVSPRAKGLEAIGYRQITASLRGEINLDETVARIQQETRRFAKRQLTWFRKEKDLVWVEGAGDDEGVRLRILADVRKNWPA